MQQPTESQPLRYDIVRGDGAQGDDKRGASCCIFLAIELGGKNKNKTKFVMI